MTAKKQTIPHEGLFLRIFRDPANTRFFLIPLRLTRGLQKSWTATPPYVGIFGKNFEGIGNECRVDKINFRIRKGGCNLYIVQGETGNQ